MIRSATSMQNIHTYAERPSQRQGADPLDIKASSRPRPLSYSTGTSAGLSPTLVRNISTNKNQRSIHRTVTPRSQQDPKTQEGLLRSSEDNRRVNRHSLTPRVSNKPQVHGNIEDFFELDNGPQRQVSRPPGVPCERPGKATNGTKEGVSRSSMSDLPDRRRNASECQPSGAVAQETHSRSDKPKVRNLRSAASFASLRPSQQTPAARLSPNRSPPPPPPPPQRMGSRQTLPPKTHQEKAQNNRLLAQTSRRDSTDTTSTVSSFSSSSSDASQRSIAPKQGGPIYQYRTTEDERSAFASDTEPSSFELYGDCGDYHKPENMERNTPSDDENQLENSFSVEYWKDKLHKEQATVKALQRQKQACNKDISFLSQSVDSLALEKQEWIKRFEAEKTQKERLQDEILSVKDSLTVASEQVRQMLIENEALKKQVEQVYGDPFKTSVVGPASSSLSAIKSQLRSSQVQARTLKATLEQFLRLGDGSEEQYAVQETPKADPLPNEPLDQVPEKVTSGEDTDLAGNDLDILLRDLVLEKELLQAEYSKMPVTGANTLTRRRREELESRLDEVDSHMSKIKLRMRNRNSSQRENILG
ncbi:hypothetical protein CLU79DRAFT_325987 [Phycomyces nitens]|nr:hypothetical protein CLU79DRAFT_325987 [Phycomyces nitens]